MAALVAVYRDRETAEAVARELTEEHVVPDGAVRIAELSDFDASIGAEMDTEVTQSWGSPGMGVFLTGEMMRGAVLFTLMLGALGLIVGLALGYFLYDESTSLGVRLGVGGLIGLLFGAVVGALLGGGLAMKSPEERLAAERGIPVAVEDAPADAEDVMVRHHPLRLDRFDEGEHVATIVTEGPHGLSETIAEFKANTKDPKRQG
jgi:hypothetical protein